MASCVFACPSGVNQNKHEALLLTAILLLSVLVDSHIWYRWVKQVALEVAWTDTMQPLDLMDLMDLRNSSLAH